MSGRSPQQMCRLYVTVEFSRELGNINLCMCMYVTVHMCCCCPRLLSCSCVQTAVPEVKAHNKD